MGILNFFFKTISGSNTPGGAIRSIKLSDWWGDLSKSEKTQIQLWFNNTPFSDYSRLDSGPSCPMGVSRMDFLSAIAERGIYGKNRNYLVAEKLFLKALDSKGKIMDRHFVYNKTIELYYRHRAEYPDALERCIEICWRDINSLALLKL